MVALVIYLTRRDTIKKVFFLLKFHYLNRAVHLFLSKNMSQALPDISPSTVMFLFVEIDN